MSGKGDKTSRYVVLGLIIIVVGLIWGFSRFSPKKLAICEVQGRGEISQYIGKKITLQGIVSADRQGLIPAGFFLIDQYCPVEEGGSQGIFVELETSGDIVHLGDEVLVKGVVEEVGGETRIMSDQSEMEVLSLGNDLPPEINLVDIFLLDPETFQYENWEGMLVSIPKGEFQRGFLDSDLPRIMPLFDLDPTLQMICLQNQSITLQLAGSEEFSISGNLSTGDQIQNLVGTLRQNIAGYVLELAGSSDFKVVGRKASPGFVEERSLAGLGSTETQVSSPGTASVTPSGTATITLIPSATIIPSLTYYPVHLLISEVYPNPSGKEPDGEWVEIYNPRAYSQSLAGIKLGDETSAVGKEGMLRFPDGYHIGGNEVLVIAHQAKAFLEEYGFRPDFELEDSDTRTPDLVPYDGWGRSSIKFSNSGDEVLLLDPWNGVVDLLVFGDSAAAGFSDPPPAPSESHSLERYPPDMDRDRGGDWRERESVSPGRIDWSPPTLAASPTQVLSVTSTSSPSASPSWTVSDTPIDSTPTLVTSTFTPTSEITPSLTNTQITTNTVTMTPTPSPSLSATSLPSPTLAETEEISQTPSSTLSESMTCTPPIIMTDTVTSTSQPAATVTGTDAVTETPLPSISPSLQPTATLTPPCLEDPQILLNEVHADPDLVLGDANRDGQVHSDDDEFLEFVNIGDVDLDLSGWSIADSVKTRYEFPEGTKLKVGCGLVIFGGGDPPNDFGGSLVFSAGSLGLNNAGDKIFLIGASGEEKLSYLYGSEGGENQSLTRWPDISGELPLVLHSEADGSNGDFFSPGTRIDGSVFGDCP